MSLAEDQIVNNSNHPFDEYSRQINRIPNNDILKGILVTEEFEDKLKRTQKTKEPEKTKEEEINPGKLLKEIKEDMTR